MSTKKFRRAAQKQAYAPVFAALGDETRLALLARLRGGRRCSISQLTEGSRLTRQAITKHLRVLEGAGLVESVQDGRESLFGFRSEPMAEVGEYLTKMSAAWDERLARLQAFVEE